MLNVHCFVSHFLNIYTLLHLKKLCLTRHSNHVAMAQVDETVLLFLTALMTEDSKPSILSRQISGCFDKVKSHCDYPLFLQYT